MYEMICPEHIALIAHVFETQCFRALSNSAEFSFKNTHSFSCRAYFLIWAFIRKHKLAFTECAILTNKGLHDKCVK